MGAALALAVPALLAGGGPTAGATPATATRSSDATVGPATAGTAPVGAPSWWQGDCDATHWDAVAKADGWTGVGAHRLGASYLGVPVCGPRHVTDHGPDVLWKASGWGEYEWECTELAFRFLRQVYGVSAYHANGVSVVANYTTADGGGLVKVTNGTTGKAPQPGDVMSFSSPSNAAGHVAVVTASSVDASGDGSITLMTQNDTTDGWRTLAVKAWRVAAFGTYAPSAWLHDPAGRGVLRDTADHRPFASWDGFVAQQQLDLTGSAGTTATRASTDADLSDGSPAPSTYIAGQMAGGWFDGHLAPVGRLYWAFFGRIPDYSGLTHWAAVHRTGRKLDAISQSFATSPEFTRTYGALDDAHFVDLVYAHVLGRAGDPSGEAYWTNQLASKAKTRGQVMAGFSQSSEYTRQKAADIGVVEAYAGMLHRAPTGDELAAGASRSITALIDEIRLGPEYAARVG